MAQRACQPRLAHKAPREGRIGGVEGAHLLERDQPIEVGLAREIHHPHPTAAELAQDAVATNSPHGVRHGATLFEPPGTDLIRAG